MSKATKHKPEEVQAEKITDFYERLEFFYEEHKRTILGVLGTLVVLLAGFVIYKKLIMGPKEKESLVQISQAQLYFEQDSFRLALNGDGNYPGFKTIADKFGGTPAGKTAKYYAGVCNLQLGNFKEAIDYFEDFKTKDPMVQAMAYGCTGDAYMELNQSEKGIELYKKAVEASGDQVTAALFLDRLAKAQELDNKLEDAIKTYEQMKTEHPNTPEGLSAEKNITRLQVMLGK